MFFTIRKKVKEVVQKNMLISKMKLYGDTQASLADALGCSISRLNAKINGTDGADFTKKEMEKIRIRYQLTDQEFLDIFFAENVSSQDTE